MERSEKREFVESLATIFAETSFVLVARNDGLTVAAVSELRRKMRAAGASYKVAKNRLATRVLLGVCRQHSRHLPTRGLKYARNPRRRGLDETHKLRAQRLQGRQLGQSLHAIGAQRLGSKSTAQDNKLIVCLGELHGGFGHSHRVH